MIDEIIPEPIGGAHLNPKAVFKTTDHEIKKELDKYIKMNPDEVAKHRYKKFRTIDNKYLHVI